jgi:hypothetical protein
MARSRVIRPEFWSDEKLASVSRESRLAFAGMWGTSDDYGVTKGNASWLKSQIFPYDDDLKINKFQEWLIELEQLRRIVPFNHDGEKYYYIPRFMEHQKVDKPSKTRNPTPPLDIDSRESSETVASDSRESSEKSRAKTETETETETLLVGHPPYETIKTLWNTILGENLAQVTSLSETRKRHIKARWNTNENTKALEWWDKFFNFITESDFLMGRIQGKNGGKPFLATFDWVFNESNFLKIKEGNYHT